MSEVINENSLDAFNYVGDFSFIQVVISYNELQLLSIADKLITLNCSIKTIITVLINLLLEHLSFTVVAN